MVLNWGLRYSLKKRGKQKGYDDFEIGLEDLCTLALGIKEKFIQKFSDTRKITFKSPFDLYFHPSTIEVFDLPSYNSELRKKYLRLLLMCLEVGSFAGCSAWLGRGQMI